MKKRLIIGIVVVLFSLIQIPWGICQTQAKTPWEDAQNEQQHDIVLVLDNSGSMIKNDPEFLARNVVTEFLSGFKGKCRFAMVIFDQEARLAEPLVEMKRPRNRTQFMESLEKVNYKGQYSDIPAAIERAIYELKINGRTSARKVIILLTDGIVDTGDKLRDVEREQWLKENLTQLSKKAGIRIFGIAFTDHTDFRLIQTLVFKTDGEYFRAQHAEDIENIFKNIHELITRQVVKPVTTIPKTIPVTPPPPIIKPVASAPPATTPALSMEQIAKTAASQDPKPIQTKKQSGALHLILAGIILVLLVMVMIIIFSTRSKTSPQADSVVHTPERSLREAPAIPLAELVDVNNITAKKIFVLGKRITKIGRDLNNDIPIPLDKVSSLHATIEYKNGFFYLEDQRSINKTFLNAMEIKPTLPVKLKSGDEIMFNIFKFKFILPHLIPKGETVVDFKGASKAHISDETVAHIPHPKRRKTDFLTHPKRRKNDLLPQAMLIDVKNITTKKTFVLNKNITKIGRDVNNEIIIPDDTVSSFHATIENKDNSYYLEDQRSKNNTFLNGEKIESYSPQKLKSGDEIVFYIFKFIFLLERQFPTGDTGERFRG